VTIEFALILPVIMILIFGALELSRAMTVQQVLTNAVREGAREGIVVTATTTDVIDRVNQVLSAGDVDPEVTVITVSPASIESANSGDDVTVRVEVPFDNVSWFPTPRFLIDYTMRSECIMRHE
jgi:Flp pilus assembly protein TadG